jgi:hypothetical protein
MIQFSKDMDPGCFAGNVELSYSDGDMPPELTLHYDTAKQTLVIRTETPLLPQKRVRLVLRRGIQDEEGIPLPSRILSRRAATALGGDSTLAAFTFTTRSEP